MTHYRLALTLFLSMMLSAVLQAADSFVSLQSQTDAVRLFPGDIQLVVDAADYPGVQRAVRSLQSDVQAVTGQQPALVNAATGDAFRIIIGSQDKSPLIQQLFKKKQLDAKLLKGAHEKYIITLIDGQLVIAGSDKRGTTYGIYELSRQLGVSPWAWWADMPIVQQHDIYLLPGLYTDGEPTVQYRGLFLNDEAPCLSGWVKEKFPDSQCENLPADPQGNTYARGFNHLFYEHVFELLLRLKANYLWPAMWGNAFYFDDPLNGPLADEMGIIMGTSHHEPMARNHQEWVRYKRGVMQKAGVYRDEDAPAEARWDYAVNKPVIDQFFSEGIERAKDTEDLITIGMRGDGDTGLGGKEGHDEETVSRDEYNKRLMEDIISNQRQIIAKVTGKKADKTPQMWALYKEVQHLYDIGLDVPEDVLIMLCDDNWGDIRRVPEANASATRSREKLLSRKGGWGMYYHVDYVGAPRNTKWANVTNPYHLWEQMRLSYEYGIDRLWILNVGDLKPMEQPIDLFLKMAWRPSDFEEASSVDRQLADFCQQMGVPEAKRLLNTYLQYNSRCTPELLTHRTYNLASGEWEQVMLQYKALEADALRLWLTVRETPSADAYHQLVLFPIQSMANLYEMYYAQAQNLYRYSVGDMAANDYAAEVERCFARDAELTADYHSIGDGKWNHLMDQKHIGYVIWQEPREQVCPMVKRLEADKAQGPKVFLPNQGVVTIEAEHYAQATGSADGQWQVVPTLGRTLSAVALLPHNAACEGAQLTYDIDLTHAAAMPDSIRLHVITNSTLPFLRKEGHRFTVQFNASEPVEVNYNSQYTEEQQYVMYDMAATRVIETIVTLPASVLAQGLNHLSIAPVDPGLVVEKLVIDLGGYQPSRLFGNESSRVPYNIIETPRPRR